MTDRRVHALYENMEIVRYERAGKWYLEPTIPGLPRQHVTLKQAVQSAVWGMENRGGQVCLGVPGGQAFDAAFSREAQ